MFFCCNIAVFLKSLLQMMYVHGDIQHIKKYIHRMWELNSPNQHPSVKTCMRCTVVYLLIVFYNGILCLVSYSLYCLHCIPCIVFHALYSLHCILCIVFCEFVLCILLYAFNSMHYILSILYIYYNLCIVFYALYLMHCMH